MRDARSEAPEPPHLRDARPGSTERCGSCKMFDSGACWGYGNRPVRTDQVCDSYAPEGTGRSRTTSETRSMTDTRVISEPRTYHRYAQHSFFSDQAMSQYSAQARQRLDAHLREVASEIDRNTVEGRRAMREYHQHFRGAARDHVEREVRAATSTTIQGFTTPQWIIDEYALYRGTQRTFADQCRSMPMPDVGLSIHVPRFTSAPSAGVQAESGAVTELDPAGADNTENVQTIAGQLTTSIQSVDRTQVAPSGPTFDLVLYEAIRDAYDQQLNNYVLGKVMALGSTVAGASAFTLANFLTDLGSAREKLQDTAGVRLMPSHLFTTPDLYSFATRQLDANGRPLITPQFFPGRPAFATGEDDGGHAGWDQFSGTVIQGTLMWFLDATIPASGANTQFLVGRPDTVLLFEGVPVARAFPQTIGQNLQVVAQMYNYAACIPRFPGGFSSVTGNAYALANA